MKDTACEHCPFKKMGFEQCPNYIETLWYQKGEPQPVIVKDCAPKRNLLMLQELYNRTFGLQQQINQAEGEIAATRASVNKLVEFVQYVEENKITEQSAKEKLKRHLSSMKYCEPEKYRMIENDINSF